MVLGQSYDGGVHFDHLAVEVIFDLVLNLGLIQRLEVIEGCLGLG